MNKKLAIILAELNRKLQTLYGPRLVRLLLYGSQARGDAESDAGIDVMVVLEGPVNPGDEIEVAGEVTAALSLKYSVVISCVFVSAERYSHEKSPLLLNVQREGVTL